MSKFILAVFAFAVFFAGYSRRIGQKESIAVTTTINLLTKYNYHIVARENLQVLFGNTKKHAMREMTGRGAVIEDGGFADRKSFCRVLEYAKTSSVTVVQTHFWTRFHKDAPNWHNIIRWVKQFEDSGCLCKGKSMLWPPRSPDLTPCDFFSGGMLRTRCLYPHFRMTSMRAFILRFTILQLAFKKKIIIAFALTGIFVLAAAIIAPIVVGYCVGWVAAYAALDMIGVATISALVIGGASAYPLSCMCKAQNSANNVQEHYSNQDFNWKTLDEKLRTMKKELQQFHEQRKSLK